MIVVILNHYLNDLLKLLSVFKLCVQLFSAPSLSPLSSAGTPACNKFSGPFHLESALAVQGSNLSK